MNYIIFVKNDEPTNDLIVKLKKIAHNLNMTICDNDYYSVNYPIHRIKVNYISENEFNSRKNNELELIGKDNSNIVTTMLDNNCIFKKVTDGHEDYAFYVIFYTNEMKDYILSFLENESLKKKEETKEVKYTRFRDIPQLTRYGNWECDFSLKELVNFIENEIVEQGLELNPDFQRGHVWTEEQQIAFIEFFLRGGKTGRVIYLNKPDWNNSVSKSAYNEYVCVDGLQRYTAIKRFINNEIKVFGSYYSEYQDSPRGTNTMRLNVNDLKTKKEVIQWYIEFNAGGTPHSDEEIDRVRKLLKTEHTLMKPTTEWIEETLLFINDLKNSDLDRIKKKDEIYSVFKGYNSSWNDEKLLSILSYAEHGELLINTDIKTISKDLLDELEKDLV